MLHPARTTHNGTSHGVSVVIPARDEAGTVGAIVAACLGLATVREVLVVDDGSSDDTALVAARAGARVLAATGGPGKGAAMWDGVVEAEGDIVVFCDADLEDFDPALVTRLAQVLEESEGTVALVKGDYERANDGGRVTELVARPVLRLLHPAIAHIAQPLGGEYAAWRSTLERVPFVRGYGVELGLLLDIARVAGPAAIAETHLGVRRHRNRPLRELAPQAQEVLAVALQRAGVPGVSVDERPAPASRPAGARRSA